MGMISDRQRGVGPDARIAPRLSLAISEARFVEIMGALDLPEPKMIKTAVPANLACGELQ